MNRNVVRFTFMAVGVISGAATITVFHTLYASELNGQLQKGWSFILFVVGWLFISLDMLVIQLPVMCVFACRDPS